jgi:hypothetical protein
MVCVNLVVPFTLRTPSKTHSLFALTMIDPATGWLEIFEVTNKSATSIQDLFHKTWLARYQRPQFIVFDNGGELKREFIQICGITIMALKPKQLQVTTHKKMQSLSEYTKLSMTCSDHLTWKIIMKL